ncbi:MAG: nuclear transport factor 2 family protein [Gammaproteobacteria bacterium]|nr:nuclear transport factor 2 family protein [Gammaproteobacteria bacterium]
MSIVDIFERFAADFEHAVRDDNWLRLEKYFAKDATYLNLGGPDPKCMGRDAILAYFKKDVTSTDRKFDSRTLVAISPPVADGDFLSREWRCTYTLNGVPDFVLEGESRYLFENNLIKSLEVELTEDSMQTLDSWMRENGDKLQI